MLFHILHYLFIGFYLVAPPVALVLDAMRAWRLRRSTPSANFLLTLIASIFLGSGIAMIYAVGIGGHIPLNQIFLAIYFAAGLLLLLKLFGAFLKSSLRRALKPLTTPTRSRAARSSGIVIAAATRALLLVAIGLPYIMAAVMTYRPKIVARDDPLSMLGFPFQPVQFESTDGVRLSGWWIPATDERGRRENAESSNFGARTILLCHGLASNKANQLVMVRELVPAGYNVLAFDFRAHGQSGGQLTSFGDLERRDVLGAVRWLRAFRPQQTEQIYGLGASMGAAALIAAAAEPSEEGRAIAAIAVYGSFDDLGLLARGIGEGRFLPPFDRIIPRIALPLASVQVGVRLDHFKPRDLVVRFWPRPILIIHGMRDFIIPFERGQRLFHDALQPKQHIWLPELDHNQIIDDEQTARAVRRFFDNARPMQVI